MQDVVSGYSGSCDGVWWCLVEDYRWVTKSFLIYLAAAARFLTRRRVRDKVGRLCEVPHSSDETF